MGTQKLSAKLLIAGGTLELLMAILHITWPFNLLQSPTFNEIPVSIKDFILIMSLALSLCMMVFAFFAFYFSKKIMLGEKSAIFFSFSQAILWIVRLILEIALPVRMPIYFIEAPSNIIILGAIPIILIFLIPVLLSRKRNS
jgi:hypothetical protein